MITGVNKTQETAEMTDLGVAKAGNKCYRNADMNL